MMSPRTTKPPKDTRKIFTSGRSGDLVIEPPGSKSYSHRALLCAAAIGASVNVQNCSPSEDTEKMVAALKKMGYSVTGADQSVGLHPPDLDAPRSARLSRSVKVVKARHRRAGLKNKDLSCGNRSILPAVYLDAGAGGAVARFLMALAATRSGRWTLDGDSRLRQRPMAPLIEALRQLGAEIECAGEPGCLPLRVSGGELGGGRLELNAGLSSQFASALLLIAPAFRGGLDLSLTGRVASPAYIDMTLEVLCHFGVRAERLGEARWRVNPPASPAGSEYRVPPDASGATCLWAAAAITGGRVAVPGLGLASPQGDCRFVRILERMGCEVEESGSPEVRSPKSIGLMLGVDARCLSAGRLKAVTCDMNAMPDAVPAMAAVAAFAAGTTRIENIGQLRLKESNRIDALQTELGKFGVRVASGPDWLEIEGADPAELRGARVCTYDDHRIAMGMALVGLRVEGVEIEDPGCVSKSYPNFWEHFSRFEGPGSAA